MWGRSSGATPGPEFSTASRTPGDPGTATSVLTATRPPIGAEGDFDLAAQSRERRAQLVTHVRREAPLALEGRLEPLEHPVQDGDQPAVFLGVGVCGDTLVQRPRRDLGRLCGDLGN